MSTTNKTTQKTTRTPKTTAQRKWNPSTKSLTFRTIDILVNLQKILNGAEDAPDRDPKELVEQAIISARWTAAKLAKA